MKKRTLVFLLVLMSPLLTGCSHYENSTVSSTSGFTWPAGLPVYDHIVIVVEENKDYEQIIGTSHAPYINKLRKEGANFTKMYAEEHKSQGNYYWLFSGDNQSIGCNDEIPSEKNNPNYPFKTANLGEQLIHKGRSFKGYSESMPRIGFVDKTDGLYARKHVPWISFCTVPNGATVETSSNLRFADFPSAPSQYAALPTVSFVIPNLIDDMHDGPLSSSVPAGDAWLEKNLDRYYRWAKDHNSLLIVTFDENDDKSHYQGLTDPSAAPRSCAGEGLDHKDCDLQNRIVTIFAGAHIKAGDYPEGQCITHVNILRTIEAMYGLGKAGAQQSNALKAGITDDYIVTDVFENGK